MLIIIIDCELFTNNSTTPNSKTTQMIRVTVSIDFFKGQEISKAIFHETPLTKKRLKFFEGFLL